MRIPIRIHELTGAGRKQDLICGGVPVERGVLKEGGWFTLKAQGARTAVIYGTPHGYWPDKSLKWLYLCGNANLAGGAENAFILEPVTLRRKGLKTEEEGRLLRIRGGVLDVEIRADILDLLTVRFAGDKKPLLKSPGLSTCLVLTGPNKTNRRACSFELDSLETPEVVEATPNRVVVRLSGKYYVPGGREVAQLRLFLEIFRESPEIHVEPVLIYTGIPDEDLVDTFSLTVHTAIETRENTRYIFSNEQGRGWEDVLQRLPNGPRWPLVRQVQLGSGFYRTEKATARDVSWVKALEGRRAQGWCDLTDDRFGVTAAMRYFWQEYPHSLETDVYAGTITFGLCPGAAEPLDLRRYSPTIYGGGSRNTTMYEYSSGAFPGRTMGATGIAKAHELCVRFHHAKDRDVPERALAFTQPCRIAVDPGYFCRTKVVGEIAPMDPPVHPKAEKAVADIMDFLVKERDVRGWYGLMNYGDMLMSYYADRDVWAFDDGAHAWLNTESIPDYGLWLSSLRSGRADWMEAAIAMSRHNRDVDTYHAGQLKGHGTRHNVNHWGCKDKEYRVSMPLSLRLHYFMTGDPWSRESILETAKVYQAVNRTAHIAPRTTSPFVGILAKWEMTGDEATGQVVRNLADLFARAIKPNGDFVEMMRANLATGEGDPVGDDPYTGHFMHTFGGQHLLSEVAELLEHKALIEGLTRHAALKLTPEGQTVPPIIRDRNTKWVKNRFYYIAAFCGIAWRHTGDRKYVKAMRDAMDLVQFDTEELGGDGIMEEPRHRRVPGVFRRNKYACGLGIFLHLSPYALVILRDAKKQKRRSNR